MSGRRWLSREARADIGGLVLVARGNGVGWKDLEAMFRFDRHTLKRYARAALERRLHQEKSDCTIAAVERGAA